MDERLEKALDFSNFRLSLHNQKQNIKNILNDKLILYHNKGQFTINSELLCFLKIFIEQNKDSCILLDNMDNPIKIVNLNKFFDEALSIYFSSINEYYTEFEKLNRARNIKKLLDLEENG